MNDQQRLADIEALARMAARLAGRNPDDHLTMSLAGIVPFDDVLWRYPDFLVRAETAYEALGGARLVRPEELNGHAGSIRRDGRPARGGGNDDYALSVAGTRSRPR